MPRDSLGEAGTNLLRQQAAKKPRRAKKKTIGVAAMRNGSAPSGCLPDGRTAR